MAEHQGPAAPDGDGHRHPPSRPPGFDHAPRRGRALWFSFGANGILLVVQVAGAVAFGSLALLADSVHQLSDVVSLAVALVAFRLAARPRSASYTYGLRRAEVMGATVNAVLLLAAGVWIVFEAVRRLGEPHDIDGAGVIVLALVGLAVNGSSAWWLARVSGANLNLRGAMVHLLADAAGSVAVLASGVAVVVWDATWLDPVLSLAIAAMVIWQGFRLVGATTRIFLEGTPQGVAVDDLEDILRSDLEVDDVHHLHVWSLDSETVALTAHIVADPPSLHEAQELSHRLEHRLAGEGVDHVTLALECHSCEGPTEADCPEGAHPEARPAEAGTEPTI
jgi:cobalt-zinc-cadmium efflux system protein